MAAVRTASPPTQTHAASWPNLPQAVLQGREVNTLVLNEPTNHLDLQSIKQFEAAVAALTRTMLVVSHDQRLLAGLRQAHRWQVANGQVRDGRVSCSPDLRLTPRSAPAASVQSRRQCS